ARGAPARGAELDLEREPDLAPVLAAVAAAAAWNTGARSVLHGLGTLPGKESSRIAVLAEGLSALGFAAEAGKDSLAIAPGARRANEPVELDPRGDHRMAFAFALLGLLREGVFVRDPACVGKSWPGFWTDLARAGVRVVERA
ncbi:MAG: 3-phosphoshikimate 1-carboxyvinyltransferase, partial [Planctomycetes bacterium]|nr:3-phosphoshikimate 1-carboxyvinyltransferase [Planctomycetota bacterium]